ncbi:hypothetical protein EXIGLDRAFT_760177 [Exidia glandulosa HHB12029]|uniref:Multiple myeloma tumor-associated protein 2-like N-terminal domain-containing protein n=1 Tax=Exidia glandulosa HHB12029 TaxID=1314781 RepID=A0A165PBN0_EXIGL|nr:hypothetical protein EXIGLDRAFT_760177 [Exidia glandulosa HHB12029]
MDMFDGPIRGGTRGGAAEFKWTDVGADKDRENYLGHSINAPTGRWQKNKDIHWYSREDKDGALERAEEIRRIKEAEADLLAIQLGFKPAPKPSEMSNVPVTAIPLPSSAADNLVQAPLEDDETKRLAREEKARRKEEKRARKEEKRERKERRRAEKEERGHRRHDSRSRSPDRIRRRSRSRSAERSHRDRDRRRSRSPPPRPRRDDKTPPYSRERRSGSDDPSAVEQERQRDRKRWEGNERRERPGDARWGR